MSRMTSAQVIGLGEYLEPDFQPSTLTVSQLLGVLNFHRVDYPTPYTKPKLVATFNSEIKPRAAKFKKERIARENSIASEDGIKDGVTGQLLRAPVPVEPTTPATRRSSRRSSVAPVDPSSPMDVPTPRAESSKRRRSSAQPSLGGASKRAAPVSSALAEESEPEDEEEERQAPPRKVGRTKKNASGVGQNRRASHISGGEDSGWEDNNIFQSGAESSSPARVSPVKPRLSRATPRQARKSTSAPPQASPPSSPSRPSLTPNPAFNFSPPPVARQLTPVRDTSPEPPAIPSREPTPIREVAPVVHATPIRQVVPARHASPLREITPVVHATPIREVVPARHASPLREITPMSLPTPAREKTPIPVSPFARKSLPSRGSTPAHALVAAEDVQDDEMPEQDTNEDLSIDAHEDKEAIDEALALMEAEQEETSSRAMTPFNSVGARGGWKDASLRMFIWAFLLTLIWLTYGYKNESSSIGFCERGTNSNAVLDKLLSEQKRMFECVARNLTVSDATPMDNVSFAKGETDEACPMSPLLPLPHPKTCTQCPDHATCSGKNAVCDTGFLLKPHILFSFIPVAPSQSTLTTTHVPGLSETFFQGVSKLTDGLPGFGSVAFPPRCVADPQRKANIGKLGKAIEAMLAKERGRRICRGGLTEDAESTEGPETAQKWGVEVEKLKEVFRKTASDKMLPQFDEMFNEAMQQLTQWGGVFIGEAADGTRYAAHKFPVMSLGCMITVKARKVWKAWRSTVLTIIVAVLAILAAWSRIIQNQKESKRVAGLVQVALDTIRNQELAHYTDPVTAPQPYLSSIQLRDLVLQDEHSVSTRKRLWDRVEAIVEENANVRVNLEEIEGGDELRVWRWVGTAGPTRTPGRKELEMEYEEEDQ